MSGSVSVLLVILFSIICIPSQGWTTPGLRSPSARPACGCQCSNQAYRDSSGHLVATCWSGDGAVAAWCYVSPNQRFSCKDVQQSVLFPGHYWSNEACASPPAGGSAGCQGGLLDRIDLFNRLDRDVSAINFGIDSRVRFGPFLEIELPGSTITFNKKVNLTHRAHESYGFATLLNTTTVALTELFYDGAGPKTNWIVGTKSPIGVDADTYIIDKLTSTGEVEYAATDLSSAVPSLPAYTGQNVTLSLPVVDGKQMTFDDISWIALYCRQVNMLFMDVVIPEAFL